MSRARIRAAFAAAHVSLLEQNALLTGLALLVAALLGCLGLWTIEDGGRFMGVAGLVALLLFVLSRGVRAYRAGSRASMPTSVGPTHIRIRPSRWFAAVAVTLALALPLAAVVALLALVAWAWLPVAFVLLSGAGGLFSAWARAIRLHGSDRVLPDETAARLLERLCLIADLPVPEVSVEYDTAALAWTAGGRIHLTTELLRRLPERELEAVLAHELAHLARRDAAAMEICSTPSRVLLSGADQLMKFSHMTARVGRLIQSGQSLALIVMFWVLAAVFAPPAWLVGWMGRLSVLGLSRSREFAADAAAVALTGNPSALASALMRLDERGAIADRPDLRQSPDAALCIVAPEPASGRLGRLFSTHPPTAERVKRLHAIERRMQERSRYT